GPHLARQLAEGSLDVGTDVTRQALVLGPLLFQLVSHPADLASDQREEIAGDLESVLGGNLAGLGHEPAGHLGGPYTSPFPQPSVVALVLARGEELSLLDDDVDPLFDASFAPHHFGDGPVDAVR